MFILRQKRKKRKDAREKAKERIRHGVPAYDTKGNGLDEGEPDGG